MIGVFWSLLMAAAFGFSQLATRKGLIKIAVDQGTFIMIAVSMILMVIPFFWVGGPTLVRQADPIGLVYFAAAGIIHFVGGFTMMNLSISTIGAARTGSLIATTPLFATFLAAVTLNELVNLPLIIGVLVVIVGVRFIGSSRPEKTSQKQAEPVEGQAVPGGITKYQSMFGLAGASTAGLLAALSWGFTPVLIKKGMESIPSPVVGVTISMVSAGVIYAVILGVRGRLTSIIPTLGQSGGMWQIGAGALVGVGNLLRWVALSFTTAAMVTTLSRASLLITVGLGGWLLGRDLEPITDRVRWGAVLIVIGSVIVVLYGQP